ncbi:MAG TPA: radical SAM protein [Syntrophorhabdales bacterium]|nr:radical SAM protein [Syntrophorhabdales bacterium]
METARRFAYIEPFEICSIRPPTENYSLTFRVSRNCAWNRCLFCPVYKLGARFSKRPLEEVKRDIDRAAILDEVVRERVSGIAGSIEGGYTQAERLIREIESAKGRSTPEGEDLEALGSKATSIPQSLTVQQRSAEEDDDDERLVWFASWFKEKPSITDSVYHLLAWRQSGARTCFLGDANLLLLSGDYVSEVLSHIRCRFPTLERFTAYGRTQSAARKDVEELALFARAGLNRIHFGVESGSDRVLRYMKKGVTASQHIEACRKTREAGISCSVYVMPGLGGASLSEEHAIETARVLTEGGPDFVRLRSLEIFPRTGLAAAKATGEFVEASEEQVAREMRALIENTKCAITVVSDSASNLLDVNGRLPEDRARMLATIDEYLSLSPRDKLVFSLHARLQSFIGQYGGVTEDILNLLRPHLHGGGIDPESMSDYELERATRFIRSKLMP